MVKNIIIGKKSFITESIIKHLKNSKAFSANEINHKKINKFILGYKKINLIFNNFYPAKLINNLNENNYQKFFELSFNKIALVLKVIPDKKINKIIYTSSSSVYGLSNKITSESFDVFNRELYSASKFAVEKLMINYLNNKKKDYYICRIFNTYGNSKDQFSFIEKIIRSKKDDKKIKLINEGYSIRDFIHLDDIGKIYSIFLTKKIKKGIYDIGTGKGFLIRDLVKSAGFLSNKILKINKIDEIQNSIADNKKLLSEIGYFKFKKVDSYLKKKLNLKNKKKIKFFQNQQNSSFVSYGSVIYGAGFAGQKIFDELKKNNEEIFCFVDDSFKLQNTLIKQTPVLSFEDLIKIKNQINIKRIYLTIPSLKSEKLNFTIKKIKEHFFDVRYLPEKKFLLSDELKINDLNSDEINKILNRKQFRIKKIKKLNGKKVIVTGAGGTIGSEICRQLLQQGTKKIFAIDNSELSIYNLKNQINNSKIQYRLLDINNYKLLEKIIKSEKIDFIFHAAAYKHVNILESNVHSAVKNNVLTTYNICNLCQKYKSKMIFISTDKAANPKSVLGYTKRVAEKICEHFNNKNKNKFVSIVRFGNVFGSSGSAITNFLDQINLNKPIKLTSLKATRYFMTIFEACHLVLQTLEVKSKEKTFVLNMGKQLRIFDIAKKLAKIKSNINPNYKFSYQIVGLQPGEKLHEKIFDNKELKQKYNKDIFFVVNKLKQNEKFINYYNKLCLYLESYSEKKLIDFLKKIRKY